MRDTIPGHPEVEWVLFQKISRTLLSHIYLNSTIHHMRKISIVTYELSFISDLDQVWSKTKSFIALKPSIPL